MHTRALDTVGVRDVPLVSLLRRRGRRSLARRGLKRLQAVGLAPFLREVPIDRLRHDDKHVFAQEGYGGQPIEDNPTYRFFLAYVQGRVDDARRGFEAFYADQFARYAFVSKGKGGMFGGSLFREVMRQHAAAGRALDRDRPVFCPDIVTRAIARRVQQRFELLHSIERDGYQPSIADPVIGVLQDDGTIFIEGGAHRAAALLALDREVMPGVLVMTARTRHVLRTLRVIK